MKLFDKFFRRSTLKPVRIALPYSRLTLDDWRSSPERVAYVGELLKQPLFLDLVGMLANIRPVHRGGVDPTTAAMLLGQRTGHDQVIASLLAAGVQPPTPLADLPPADYNAENTMALWERGTESEPAQ